MTTIDEDRATFRERVLESRRLIRDGDADGANAITESLTRLLSPWEAAGQLAQLLSPLLDAAEKEWVRYSAASYALSRGLADLAVPVLEDIEQSDKGFASIGAELLLRRWRDGEMNGAAAPDDANDGD